MKLKLDIDPDIVAMMAAEVAAGERAVTAAMREAGSGLKSAWRLQITGAGLGPRLANSIRSQNFPRSGESLDAAALVWSKAPVIVGAHDTGPLIRSKNGFWLAIPLPAAGKSLRGGRITPGYADLVALCQFLPGTASSQVGFALGLLRGGPLGALAAWAAFTLPSALLLVLFAFGASAFEGPVAAGLLHGLKIVAVAVVAQAVWGMARTLAPDRQRASIAVAAVLMVVFAAGSVGQIVAIIMGSLAGLWLCRGGATPTTGHLTFGVPRRVGTAVLALFFLLLVLLPIPSASATSQGLALFDALYRAGSLVFGGGHVVLPLLEAEVVHPGWVSANTFLAGYGAAQAVPGPLFTFAAYLGAVMGPEPNGVAGAAISLVAIFLPGFLMLIGALPFLDALRTRPLAQAAMRGANAAVVGILGAALYDPVWTSAIFGPHDFALGLTGFVLLTVWKAPPWVVVLLVAAGGAGLAVL